MLGFGEPDDLRRDVSLGARRIAHAVDLTVRAARQAVPQRRVLASGGGNVDLSTAAPSTA